MRTAENCIAHLAEPWDEVHLDHDLGGDVFVDFERDDCGMAVVRWLCAQPRAHLAKTRFFVHTHNLNAACLMVLHLEVMGYEVRVRPFGTALDQPARPGRLRSLAGAGDPVAPERQQAADGPGGRRRSSGGIKGS